MLKECPRLFMHTKKAANHGHPGDRLFLVVGEEKEGRTTHFHAWKCEITSKGVWHPGFKRLLTVKEVVEGVGSILEARNGAEPTAWFHKDSYYVEITPDKLSDLISKSKNVPVEDQKKQRLKNALAAGSKLSASERDAIVKAFSCGDTSSALRTAWSKK